MRHMTVKECDTEALLIYNLSILLTEQEYYICFILDTLIYHSAPEFYLLLSINHIREIYKIWQTEYQLEMYL